MLEPARRAPSFVVKEMAPKLLVSVRSRDEAVTAWQSGADLIDVKEPSRGALGRPDEEVVEAVAASVGTVAPVSVALGELADLTVHDCHRLFQWPHVRFAKVGLAGIGGDASWSRRWHGIWDAQTAGVERVGAVYADWREAEAPRPLEAIAVFADSGCGAVLFDTFSKDGRTLLDCAPPDVLAGWIDAARAAAPLLVLAGSLQAEMLGRLRDYAPDYVAVRGAVCRGGRGGRVCSDRVRGFKEAVEGTFGNNGVARHSVS